MQVSSAGAADAPPRAARLAVNLLFLLNGALFASWVARLPAVQNALGLSHSQIGSALLAAALGSLIAMPATGAAVARYGSRRVSWVMALGYVATMPWMAAANSWLMLALALLVYGAFYGGLDVTMNAQAVAVEGRYGRPIMSSFHAVFSLGGLAGAAAGGGIAALGLTPLPHFLGAATLLGGLTALIAFPRLLEAGDAHAPVAAGEPRGWRFPPGRLIALGFLAFCIMMGEGAMGDWSAIYLEKNVGTSESVAATGFAAFSVAMALGRLFGDGLAERLGPRLLVQGGSGLAAAGLALGLVVGGPGAALVAFACVGLGFSTIVPQVFSAAGRIGGTSPGPAIATATTIGYTGFLLGPPLIGFVADLIGLRLALGVIVLVSLVAFALAPAVRRASLDRAAGDQETAR